MQEKQHIQISGNDLLLVDDDITNLQLLSELLSSEGYHVRPANSPQLGIESALAQPPSLILLDVRMPKMDGFEVCTHLKQDKRTREIPIIFISALQDVEDRVRGLEVGGVDFITKPFQEKEVLARVRTHLDMRNMQLSLEEIVAERTAELTKSEIKYRSLVENSMAGIFITTVDGRFEFVNDSMARMLDFDSPEQMIAQKSPELWSDLTERNRLMAILQKYGSVTNFETEVITHTDRKIHVISSVKLLGDELFGMVMDNTERKQFENKIVAYQKIDQVANSKASVLITGETGTGKELCAQALHQASQR
ncbi:MAG: response regulator, partial [Deltaproteobacteria bacterium]|nr:response regulator [Deltaproteobacteria bacterium]